MPCPILMPHSGHSHSKTRRSGPDTDRRNITFSTSSRAATDFAHGATRQYHWTQRNNTCYCTSVGMVDNGVPRDRRTLNSPFVYLHPLLLGFVRLSLVLSSSTPICVPPSMSLSFCSPFKLSPIHFTFYAIKYAVVKIVKETMNQEWSKPAVVFVMAHHGNKRASAARNNAAFKFLFRFVARRLVSLPSVGNLH